MNDIKNQDLDKSEDIFYIESLVNKAQKAMKSIEDLNQSAIDRLCQAVGWSIAKNESFNFLAKMSIEESGMGDFQTRYNKRFKIHGVLRDILDVRSIGIIEKLPERGIVKYGKPAGVIAAIVPCTNPVLTPAVTALFSLKCKDATIFSPHPRTKKSTFEAVNLMRKALIKESISPDLLQCIPEPTISLTNILMKKSDLVMATGGKKLVESAYSSGTPAYGVGEGNSTVIIDETANIKEAARFTCLSKTFDNGTGCSADGNVIVDHSIYSKFLMQLEKEGGYLSSSKEKDLLKSKMWDCKGNRTPNTIAIPAYKLAQLAGFTIPKDKKFIIIKQSLIGKENFFSREKLAPVLAIYKYSGFRSALKMVKNIFNDSGGIGHSCAIYSFSEEHINKLAQTADVSRIMVRQPQSLSNAGSFTNGMPMTTSLGCGTWGGNITNENINLRHFMNITWVSQPIQENKPSDEYLFGEFINT